MGEPTPPRSYEFTLRLAGPDVTSGEHYEIVTAATGDAALFGRRGEEQYASFDLEAPTFPDAVRTAFDQLDGALPGLRVIRIEPEDLVNASEIAERTGRTRQSISQLVKGQRGPGGFPRPVAFVRSTSPLWSWSEVSRWFAQHDPAISHQDRLNAEWIAAVNGALQAREHGRRLAKLGAETHGPIGEPAALPGDELLARIARQAVRTEAP